MIFSIEDNKNREFWFSHFIIFLATIFGVYLAASAGLKTAIQLELIKSDRDSYYMRSALLAEFKDNLKNIETWGTEYRSGKAFKFIKHSDDFRLEKFVWKSMQYSPSTFEIPSTILTNIRRYYHQTDVALQKMTSKKPAAKEVEKMLKQTKELRTNILPLLEADIATLKAKLNTLDIDL